MAFLHSISSYLRSGNAPLSRWLRAPISRCHSLLSSLHNYSSRFFWRDFRKKSTNATLHSDHCRACPFPWTHRPTISVAILTAPMHHLPNSPISSCILLHKIPRLFRFRVGSGLTVIEVALILDTATFTSSSLMAFGSYSLAGSYGRHIELSVLV